jgi:hypothetical protein
VEERGLRGRIGEDRGRKTNIAEGCKGQREEGRTRSEAEGRGREDRR